MHEAIRRNLKGGEITQEVLADDGARHRRDHDGRELRHPEIANDDLNGEQRAGDGGIECGRDTGGGAAPNERTQPALVDLEPLSDGRAEGGADLHDGSLTANRPS